MTQGAADFNQALGRTVAGSILMPGPMVEDTAMRWT
jgi:hypothetical protein